MRKKFYGVVFYELEVEGSPASNDDALAVLKGAAEGAGQVDPALGAVSRLEWGLIPKMEHQRVRFLARLPRAAAEG